MSSASADSLPSAGCARVDRRVDDLDAVGVQHARDLGQQAGRVAAARSSSVMPRRASCDTSMSELFPCSRRARISRTWAAMRASVFSAKYRSGSRRTAAPARRRPPRLGLAEQTRRRPLPLGDNLLALGAEQVGPATQERQRPRVELARAASPSSWTWRRARPTRSRRTSGGRARAASPRRRTARRSRRSCRGRPDRAAATSAPSPGAGARGTRPAATSSSSMPEPAADRRPPAPRRSRCAGCRSGLPTSCSSVPTASADRRVTSRIVSLGDRKLRRVLAALRARAAARPRTARAGRRCRRGRCRAARGPVDGSHSGMIAASSPRSCICSRRDGFARSRASHRARRSVGPLGSSRSSSAARGRQLADAARACRSASGTSSPIATWKIRIISDGLLSKIAGSIGSSAPSRTTKFVGASPPASISPAGSCGACRRARSRAAAGARSRCGSAWRARGTGASAPRPRGAPRAG